MSVPQYSQFLNSDVTMFGWALKVSHLVYPDFWLLRPYFWDTFHATQMLMTAGCEADYGVVLRVSWKMRYWEYCFCSLYRHSVSQPTDCDPYPGGHTQRDASRGGGWASEWSTNFSSTVKNTIMLSSLLVLSLRTPSGCLHFQSHHKKTWSCFPHCQCHHKEHYQAAFIFSFCH